MLNLGRATSSKFSLPEDGLRSAPSQQSLPGPAEQGREFVWSSRDFARVQFGIGRPPGRMQVADFVLRELKGSFLDDFELTVERAADLVEQTL